MMKSLLMPFYFAKGIFARSVFIRYVFSGGTAALIEVVLFNVGVIVFDVYYLSAEVFAMSIAFIVRFLLQKYVTFLDRDESKAGKQFIYYSILYLASLGATAALMSLFVETLHFTLQASQILSIILVAAGCFFIYRFIIFKKP